MSSLAIAPSMPRNIQQWKSPSEIKDRVQAIQHLMNEVLKPGTKENDWSGDYGVIPGTGSKPSLWKSGSEQILAMFEIAVEPVVEDLSTDDCFRYRVTARLTHAATGNFLGAGVGECSSDETKYKWRKTYNKQEFESTDPARRRMKYSQYKDGQGMWVDKEEMQVRQEPADLANTILKMAKKRAQIDATLTVTGASSMFDQDLEDLTEEQKQSMQDRKQTRGKKEKPAAQVKCTECGAVGGHLPKCSKSNHNQAQAKPENTICGDCGKTNGHETTCKYAAPSMQPQASGLTKMAVLILGIDRLKKKANSKGIEDPYMRIKTVDPSNHEELLYLWHKTPQEHLTDAFVDKPMLCEVSGPKKRADGSQYYSIENILEVAGSPWSNNMPAQQGTLIPPDKDDDF